MCCCASSNIEALARYVGLETRGWAINGHSVPEVFYDNSWHMLDASLVNYFPKADGKAAGVEEIVAAVKAWLVQHPECRKNEAKLLQFHRAGGWTGWKQGPELLSKCPFYDPTGWWPAKTHGWYSTMQEFDGSGGTPFPYEYGYSQGYEVNVALRPGERLVRNWFNKGQHVNGILKDGDSPGCLQEQVGQGFMAYLTKYDDLNSGRIGSGAVVYDVPLGDGSFKAGAFRADNLAATSEDSLKPAVHAKDARQPGVLEIRMPSSYVYLGGVLSVDAATGRDGKIGVFLSDNNGLDWKEVASIQKSGVQKIGLEKFILRRYDYILRLVFHGRGTGLNRLRISNAMQCSQRPLPTLAQGENTITFSAGPQEGTITIEGTSLDNAKGKNVALADYHPTLKNVGLPFFRVKGVPAEATFAISTPGDMTRLRLGGFFRLRDMGDRWKVSVSFDGGRTFRKADEYAGPCQGKCQYTTFPDVPPATRAALVRFSGVQRNTCCLFLARIDADYHEPHGGFRPVKITYLWEEGGIEKRDVHIAARAAETYTIRCESKPQMKSILLELLPTFEP
jgi:hypothetical protein